MLNKAEQAAEIRADDDFCDRFEDALRRGERPSIDQWLCEAGPLAEAVLPELVAEELEYRLNTLEPATAAEYLTRYPVLSSNPEAAICLVAAEFRAARTHDPSLNEFMFRRRYPELGCSTGMEQWDPGSNSSK